MPDRLSSDDGEEGGGKEEEEMPRAERPEEKPRHLQEGAASGDSPKPSSVDREEQELRAQFAELGFVPVDPSKLEKGPPLSQDDWQALYRFYRHPTSMNDAEKLRIIRLCDRYETWHLAEKEVIEQWTSEGASKYRN